MKELEEYYQALLDRYIKGELSSEDEQELLSWLEPRDDRKELLEHARRRNMLYLLSSKEADDQWINLESAIAGKQKGLFYHVIRYAAAILLVFAAGAITHYYMLSFEEDEPRFSVIEIPYGERGKVILPDSTVVWMNSGSAIKYSSNYGSRDREVQFDGEAYFEVTQSATTFTINSGPVRVLVLGTSFNFKSYPDDETVETSLYTGQLAISHSADGYSARRMIDYGSRVVLDREKLLLTGYRLGDGQSRPDWMMNRVVFNNNSFAEIARQLERRFGFRIEILNDELSRLSYTGRFVNNENLDEILTVISRASPVEFSIRWSEKEKLISLY